MKHVVIFFALLGALTVPVQAGTLKASVGLAAPVSPADLHPELMQLVCAGEIEQLHVILDEFDCTLSAELTYNGIGMKLSITAKTCEEAGAGLAKAVKAFYKEASK